MKATFAAGCFWQVEADFRRVEGVTRTTAGYTGGNLDRPSYEDVCTDRTGHAEAVEVEFDPQTVSYEQLLEVFWSGHDPTQLNRQGPDIGTQYRSAIFVHDEEQERAAQASRERARERFDRRVVTEIVPAATFWPAEDYHQRYLEKRGLASCTLTLQEQIPDEELSEIVYERRADPDKAYLHREKRALASRGRNALEVMS